MSRVFMNAADRISQNVQAVQNAIVQACRRSGRSQENVHLMAVTKYAKDEDVLALLASGRVLHIGESRVQQAAARWNDPKFASYTTVKHFIGHLQRNKAAQAAKLFDFIDSIDDLRTAQALDGYAQKLGKRLYVMVQIKLTDRQSQSGIALENAPFLVKQLQDLKNLCPCGYLAIAPQTDNVQTLRPLFREVKAAFDRDFPLSLSQRYLSLGMSADFETAVEEGATLPRIGSRLFG